MKKRQLEVTKPDKSIAFGKAHHGGCNGVRLFSHIPNTHAVDCGCIEQAEVGELAHPGTQAPLVCLEFRQEQWALIALRG